MGFVGEGTGLGPFHRANGLQGKMTQGGTGDSESPRTEVGHMDPPQIAGELGEVPSRQAEEMGPLADALHGRQILGSSLNPC